MFAYPVLKSIQQRVDFLRVHQYQQRPVGIAISGVPSQGKTVLLEYLHATALKEGKNKRRSVMVTMGNLWSVNNLYNSVFEALNVPTSTQGDEQEKYNALSNLVKRLNVQQILLDDFHEVLRARQKPTQLLSATRRLCNLPGVTVIIAGTPSVHNLLATDDQLKTRFERFELKGWTLSQEYIGLLRELERDLPLPEASGFGDQQTGLASEALRLGAGTLGGIFRRVADAAVYCIERNLPCITAEALQNCKPYQS